MEIKIKNKDKERRGPDSEPNMRYFKIPLCRIFTENQRSIVVRWHMSVGSNDTC